MTPDRIVTFRRVPLAQACRTLPAEDLRLLVALTLGACPQTGRVWTTPLRLAEEFRVAPAAVDTALERLVDQGHASLWSRSHGALRGYEIGPALVRHLGEPPDNLPVGPLP